MKTRMMILTALFAALSAIGAFLRIPVGESSFTLQVLFTCLAGVLLGPVYGALSQLVYVLLGLIGLPVFTTGGGIGYLFQPTFGFLLGLIPMAWTVGMLAGDGLRPLRTAGACAAGVAVLYLAGMPYMALILNVYMGKAMSLNALLWAGMLPFLSFDALKIAVVSVVSAPLCRSLPRVQTTEPVR